MAGRDFHQFGGLFYPSWLLGILRFIHIYTISRKYSFQAADVDTLLLPFQYDTLNVMNETQFTHRQSFILNLVNSNKGIGRGDIEKLVKSRYPASKATIWRDLSFLLAQEQIGFEGRNTRTIYLPVAKNPLLVSFDLDQYFAQDPDKRVGEQKFFDFSVFEYFNHQLFSKDETRNFEENNQRFSEAERKLPYDIYRNELERFVIELAWKSSKIEGNTYTLLETETLIKRSIEAVGHSREEAIMILNHKLAFESILTNKGDFQYITISKILQLHNILVKDLNIGTGIREHAVGITGTVYKPLDNKWQIDEAMEKLLTILQKAKSPIEKALIANAMISYIQPFSDGNKRTSRMLANAILLAGDYYPLSYRSADEETYKKAIIVFYEQLSILSLKKIFLEQYRFALNTYFQT